MNRAIPLLLLILPIFFTTSCAIVDLADYVLMQDIPIHKEPFPSSQASVSMFTASFASECRLGRYVGLPLDALIGALDEFARPRISRFREPEIEGMGKTYTAYLIREHDSEPVPITWATASLFTLRT